MRFIIVTLSLLVMTVPTNAETIYYLVRHAEKVKDDSKDPALTPKGIIRANTIAKMLADKHITHIFSSDLTRTRDTAAPTAAHFDLKLELYDPENLSEIADKVKAMTGRILISGHSNTTPPLVNLIAGTHYPDLEDHQYDHMFIIIKDNSGHYNVKIEYIEPKTP